MTQATQASTWKQPQSTSQQQLQSRLGLATKAAASLTAALAPSVLAVLNTVSASWSPYLFHCEHGKEHQTTQKWTRASYGASHRNGGPDPAHQGSHHHNHAPFVALDRRLSASHSGHNT